MVPLTNAAFFYVISSHRVECRKFGSFWGQTQAVPADQHITTAPPMDRKGAVSEIQQDNLPSSAATPTHTPPVSAERNISQTGLGMVSAATSENPKSRPRKPELSSDRPSSHTLVDPPCQQPKFDVDDHEGRGGQGQNSKDGVSGRQRQRKRQQKKPAVVREVRLAPPPANSATAVAAALLLTDGQVWWVPDLQAGTWEQVTVSASGAEATADGVARDGFLAGSGASSIAVVRLPVKRHVESGETDGSNRGGKSVAGKEGIVDCRGTGSGIAIVVGRDDGRLLLLTQRRPPLTGVDEARAESGDDGEKGEKQPQPASSPRPWRIDAAWKGHRSRVTAIWAIGDAAQSRPLHAPEGGSQGFTAALDTSRLCVSSRNRTGERGGGEFCGSLASAGGDGTLAWWEWACTEQDGDGGVPDDGDLKSSFGEATTRAPRLRMVSRICGSRASCFSALAWFRLRLVLHAGRSRL